MCVCVLWNPEQGSAMKLFNYWIDDDALSGLEIQHKDPRHTPMISAKCQQHWLKHQWLICLEEIPIDDLRSKTDQINISKNVSGHILQQLAKNL